MVLGGKDEAVMVEMISDDADGDGVVVLSACACVCV